MPLNESLPPGESPPTRRPPVKRTRKILYSLLSLLFFYGLCEITFQAIGFDFSRTTRDLQRVPVFYRIPTMPFGRAYYRRPGLQKWTGKVVTAQMQHIGYDPKWFPAEQEITLAYDADGFRNPSDLEDWKIVMIGDSFTELGNLKFDDLVSTRLGKLLGQPVKNLGISHTGILNQTACLEHFGVSESTRHVIWVFFEGNDLEDLVLESGRIARIEAGTAEHIDLLQAREPQSSLTRAVMKKWLAPARTDIYGPVANATLQREGESPTRFKLDYTPLGSVDLHPVEDQFNSAIKAMAEVCRQRELKLWCLYMPTKRRAFHQLGYRLDEDAAEHLSRGWEPTDLPAWLSQQCRGHGITFVDATAELVALNGSGQFSHNLIFDTHLTAAGAGVIAALLAGELAGHPENDE